MSGLHTNRVRAFCVGVYLFVYIDYLCIHLILELHSLFARGYGRCFGDNIWRALWVLYKEQ